MRASASGVTFMQVSAVAVKLPEVEISKSYGTPALKVRGKLLARLKEDGETLVLRTDFVSRQILTQADPDTFFFTDHYRDYPLVLVRLAAGGTREADRPVRRRPVTAAHLGGVCTIPLHRPEANAASRASG